MTQNSFVYILKIIGAEMEEKLVQWNPGLTIFAITIVPVQRSTIFCRPNKSYSKMYGAQARYNDS